MGQSSNNKKGMNELFESHQLNDDKREIVDLQWHALNLNEYD